MLPDASERRAFVVCHQMVEPHLDGRKDDSGFKAFDVCHWHALDGRNDWREFDTIGILGLPYRDNVWSLNTILALQGFGGAHQTGKAALERYKETRKKLISRKMATEVIQALNRICIREVIDEEGNCPHGVGVLLLPDDEVGETIISFIRSEMPNIQILEDWRYAELRNKDTKPNYARLLVGFLKIAYSGRYSATELQKKLGISSAQWKRLVMQMQDSQNWLHQALTAIGVRYVVEGAGRTCRAYLVKASGASFAR
jgi:hypothetical protein